MTNLIKPLVIGILAAGIGLWVGYLWFGQNKATTQKKGTAAESAIWTCSMHPQIRQQEPGLCPICAMDLTSLKESKKSNKLVLEMTREAALLSNIQTQVVGAESTTQKEITLNGVIKMDERRLANQVTHLPGRIEQLYVSFKGEKITKGQKMATLYAPEFISAQRELLEAKKFADVNPELLTAARKKFKYWKISDAIIQSIEESGQIQETIDIFAEVNGIVMERRVAVGDHVMEGAILYHVADLSRLWVLFDVYESDLPFIQEGNQIRFTTTALPGRVFTSKVSYIDPMISAESRAASVRAEITNATGQFKPEMFVEGTLAVRRSKAEALTVPKSAVMWTGPRSVVYVKVPDTRLPSFEYREVLLGASIGDRYLIEEGLQPGEEVVVNGSFTIDAAAQLNNQRSMMNQMVGVKGEAAPAKPDYESVVADDFKTQMEKLLQTYIILKDTLVASNPAVAQTLGQQFLDHLNTIDADALKGDPKGYWLKNKTVLETHAAALAEQTDLEKQREAFEWISNTMIDLVQVFGATGPAVFVQHCPMAFEDKGADWLSYDDYIRNPYFGDLMLKCGVVKDSFLIRN